MIKKCLRAVIFLLLLIMVLPVHVYAMESVTVGIPFTIENAPGTVVIEAENGSPLPDVSEFADVSEGRFELTYTEPGDYYYRIYQKAGTEASVTYDETVYNMNVSVFVNDDGELYSVVVVSIEGDAHKPESIVFTNIKAALDVSIDKMQARGDGEPTKDRIHVVPGDVITYFITVSNTGEGIARDMSVSDEIPSGLGLVAGSISNGGSASGNVITWNLGDLAAGSPVTLSFQCTVPNVDKETIWINQAEGTYTDDSQSEAVGHKMETGKLSAREMNLYTNEVEAVYTPEAVSTPTPEPDANTVTSPKTGDESNPMLWIFLMLGSCAILLHTMTAHRVKAKK